MDEKSGNVTSGKPSNTNEVDFRHSGTGGGGGGVDCEVGVRRRERVPRRVIHCNDGVIEEYSTDDDDNDVVDAKPPVDPKTLPWPRWCWHYVKSGAVKSLAAADYCGEKLAWFFGITSPKYQYVLDEYNRQRAQEEEERKRAEREQDAERQRNSVELSDTQQQQQSPVMSSCGVVDTSSLADSTQVLCTD